LRFSHPEKEGKASFCAITGFQVTFRSVFPSDGLTHVFEFEETVLADKLVVEVNSNLA